MYVVVSGSAHRRIDNEDGRIGIRISLHGDTIGHAFAWARSTEDPVQLTTFSKTIKGVTAGHQQIRIEPCCGSKFVQGKDFFTVSILEFAGELELRQTQNEDGQFELCGD